MLGISGVDQDRISPEYDQTPIMAAAINDHWPVVKVLFNNGASLDFALKSDAQGESVVIERLKKRLDGEGYLNLLERMQGQKD